MAKENSLRKVKRSKRYGTKKERDVMLKAVRVHFTKITGTFGQLSIVWTV